MRSDIRCSWSPRWRTSSPRYCYGQASNLFNEASTICRNGLRSKVIEPVRHWMRRRDSEEAVDRGVASLPISKFSAPFELPSGVFAKLSGCLIQPFDEFFRCHLHALSGRRDQLHTFVGVHKARGFEQTDFILFGDDQESVFVGVNQLSGFDPPAKDFDFAAPSHWARISVADAQTFRQRLESGVVHLV